MMLDKFKFLFNLQYTQLLLVFFNIPDKGFKKQDISKNRLNGRVN